MDARIASFEAEIASIAAQTAVARPSESVVGEIATLSALATTNGDVPELGAFLKYSVASIQAIVQQKLHPQEGMEPRVASDGYEGAAATDERILVVETGASPQSPVQRWHERHATPTVSGRRGTSSAGSSGRRSRSRSRDCDEDASSGAESKKLLSLRSYAALVTNKSET